MTATIKCPLCNATDVRVVLVTLAETGEVLSQNARLTWDGFEVAEPDGYLHNHSTFDEVAECTACHFNSDDLEHFGFGLECDPDYVARVDAYDALEWLLPPGETFSQSLYAHALFDLPDAGAAVRANDWTGDIICAGDQFIVRIWKGEEE